MAIVKVVADEAVRSVAEVTELVRNLSDADLLRLKKASQYMGVGGIRSSTELLQEAVKRTIEGTRKCPRQLNLAHFLIGVMRSIASADRKAVRRSPELSVVPKSDSSAAAYSDPRASPEDLILMLEEQAEIRRRVLEIFEDDLVAQTMIEGMMEGMEGEELRGLVGLSKREFATKHRLVRRRIDKTFPHGWTR